MALKIQSTMVPEGEFPVAMAKHIEMPDGKRLSEENFAPEQPTEVDITDFNESGIITETYEDGTENTYTFVYDEETDSTTITDSEGNQTVIKGMYNGGESTKFVSPTVDVTEIEGGHRVTVTDKDGTETFDVMDGADGINGTNGTNGADGADGISPTVDVTEIEGGHRVTITDAEGTQTFDVLDGTGSTAEILSGDTASVTPSAVATAVQEGRPVVIGYVHSTYGTLKFTEFFIAESLNVVIASSVFELGGVDAVFNASLVGDIEGGTWSFTLKEIATADDIVAELPEVTADDDGKFLGVAGGAWAKVDAPEDGGGASSWNDLTDKPFGEEATTIFEGEFQDELYDSDGDGTADEWRGASEGIIVEDTSEVDLIVGQTYIVVWDGTTYVSKCADLYGLHSIGNTGLMMQTGDTGEPFIIARDITGLMFGAPGWSVLILEPPDITASGLYTCKIACEKITLLDDKYQKQTNWEETDKNSAAYMLNRPFYDIPVEDVVAETTIELSGEMNALGLFGFELYTYDVTWNGTKYTCTAVEEDGDIKLGNLRLSGSSAPDTGEPFLFVDRPNDDYVNKALYVSESGTHTFSIKVAEGNVKKLDSKYLPDTVATEDWVKTYVEEYEEKTVTALDLSGYESGNIIETYSDGSTLTHTLTFDADGNITKITDSNGNETVITW